MARDFAPVQAADLKRWALEADENGKHRVNDLGPVMPIQHLLYFPERPYLVEGVLTQGSLALLSAESFVGKTFFAMELARAVSTGTPFMGKYKTFRGGVLYIAQDGSDEEYARQWRKLAKSHFEDYLIEAPLALKTWRKLLDGGELDEEEQKLANGNTMFPPFNDRVRFYFNRALGIDSPSDLTRIGMTALRMVHSHGEVWVSDPDGSRPHIDPSLSERGARLIVFDAGHSVFFGNENDAGEVQNVMTNLRQLAIATGATILLLVHLNKYGRDQRKTGVPAVHENRVRGSGVFQSAPDWHMQLHRGRGENEVYAFQLKDRAGNRCKSFIYTMVFDEAKEKMTLTHARDLTPDEHRGRKVMPATPREKAPDAAQTVWAEFEKDREMSKADVTSILRTLPQYLSSAEPTLETKAKKIISALVKAGRVHQTRSPSRGKPALYRRASTG